MLNNDDHGAPWPARYDLLDGLRGLAALVVVLHHHGVATLGHHAVMVFFVISGYCITAATSGALSSGSAGFGAFMARRLRRIFPPYILALAFFASTRVIREAFDRGAGPPDDPVAWLQNLTMTQWLSLLVQPGPDPANNPTLFVAAFWSLNYEEQFYLVMAVVLLLCRARPARLPIALAAVTAASACWLWLAGADTFRGLFVEYWPHFAAGGALCLVLTRAQFARWRGPFAIAMLAVSGGCVFALQAPSTAGERLWLEFAVIGATVAALVALRPLSGWVAGTPAWRPFAALGTISYSLYLVHQFNLTLTSTVAAKLVGGLQSPPLEVAVAVALQLLIATAFWYACERPFLNRGASRTPRAAPVAVAGRG
jgi:peptidoglycan/LPS O-acetylase OafA/YrhL